MSPRAPSHLPSFAAVAAAAALLSMVACASAAPTDRGPTKPISSIQKAGDATSSGQAVDFRWMNVEGGQLTPAELNGRISVLAFITTYDAPSQIQIRFLSKLTHTHTPRLNAVAVVLEPEEHQPLVAAYASSLDVKFPFVIADKATIRGEGTFAGLHHVPAIAILDKSGIERFRHLGLLSTSDLDAAVTRVEKEHQ